MHLAIGSLYKRDFINFIKPLLAVTLLLLIYRLLQRLIINPQIALTQIISIGILFSSAIWLLLLPFISILRKRINIRPVANFLLLHSGGALVIGLLQSFLFVFFHNMLWPGIINPSELLAPIYLLADLRLNFLIYWTLIGGFYLQYFLRGKNSPVKDNNHLKIQINSKSIYIPFENIVLIKALGNYVTIVETLSGKPKKEIIRDSMKRIDQILPYPDFLRVQKSYIINGKFLKDYKRGKHGEFILRLVTGDRISASRHKTAKIKIWINRKFDGAA